MNKGQIRTLTANFLGDPGQTRYADLYSDAIDRAQEQFAYDSKALFKDHTTYTVVDGTATYDLPTDFWLEKMVTHKGLELDPATRHELQRFNGNDWTQDNGTPNRYIIDPEEARKQIRLYPKPQANDAGANLVLTYYPVPAALSGDSAVPLNSSSLMVQFHIGIAAYAAWLILMSETMTPEVMTKRASLMSQYQDKVTDAVDYFGNTPSAPINIRGPRRR